MLIDHNHDHEWTDGELNQHEERDDIERLMCDFQLGRFRESVRFDFLCPKSTHSSSENIHRVIE